MSYDSYDDTMNHIVNVQELGVWFVNKLQENLKHHDETKLQSPEKEILDRYTPILKGQTYGSDECKNTLKDLKVALDHHYKHNRHHPEHFTYDECNGCFTRYDKFPNRCKHCGYSQFQVRPDISKMNLFDLVEMLLDWKAATYRHDDRDIRKSLEVNILRFEIGEQLASILKNTIDVIP